MNERLNLKKNTKRLSVFSFMTGRGKMKNRPFLYLSFVGPVQNTLENSPKKARALIG